MIDSNDKYALLSYQCNAMQKKVINILKYLTIFCYQKEEEKKVREELETLKLKYLENKKKNAQLALDLDASLSQLQSLKVSYFNFM